MGESQVLCESISPNGNLQALAEEAGGVIYFYVCGPPGSAVPMKSCWVRNIAPAPAELDTEGMKAGRPPLLPRTYCAHPAGAPLPDPRRLRVVWFEEGDAAALLEGDELLAVIPAWSGVKGFDGYARDCTLQSPMCWPLGKRESNAMFERVRRAEEYWTSWDEDPWPRIQEGLVGAAEAVFGREYTYYAIDGGKWPPKALLRYTTPARTVFLTVGVCVRPQPAVEMYVEDPSSLRRIELGLCIDTKLVPDGGLPIGSYLSAQSSLPWDQFTWLGPGHTIGCDVIPPGPSGTQFDSLLLHPRPSGAPPLTLPPFRGDPVNLLWMVPVTHSERELAVRQGSGDLIAKLTAAGHGWEHRDRKPVA